MRVVGWIGLFVGLGVTGYVAYRVISAKQAGVSVRSALEHPVAPIAVLKAELKANTGAGHF